MLTLTYGYKKPETNDKGPIVFPALEGDIQQLNDHDHDGANSALIPGSSVLGSLVNVPSGSWAGQPNGEYNQIVNLPAAYDYDKNQISIRLASTKETIYPKIEKVAAAQIKLWSNDNTLSFEILIGG